MAVVIITVTPNPAYDVTYAGEVDWPETLRATVAISAAAVLGAGGWPSRSDRRTRC